MRKLICIGVLIIFISLFSCRRERQSLSALTIAEELIFERPDSSLQILQSIDTTDLKQPLDRALYGMLLTMAQDKCHLIPSEENQIKYSSIYYHQIGDIYHEMLSNYYLGRALFLNGNLKDALMYFFAAKNNAEKIGNHHIASLSCRGISQVFQSVYLTGDQLQFALLQYQHAKEAGTQPYLDYAMLNLATAYYNDKNYEEAIHLSQRLTDSLKYENSALYYKAMHIRVSSLIWQNKFNEALPLIEDIYDNGYASHRDSMYLAWEMIEIGNPEIGKSMAESLPDDEDYRHHLLKLYYKQKGDYKEAYNHQEKLYSIMNEQRNYSQSLGLASTISEYYDTRQGLIESQLREKELKTWIVYMSCGLILLIFIIIFTMLYKRAESKLKNKIMLAEELSNIISDLKSSHTNNHKILQDLLRDNQIIDELCIFNKEDLNRISTRKRIAKTINEIINDYAINGNKYQDMQNYINHLHSNVLIRLKEDIPNLNEKDMALFIYSVLDISTPSIMVLMKEDKIESVYSRKKRLKEKIKLLDETLSSLYLSYLNN